MTTTPNLSLEDDEPAKIPQVCRLLFNALVDAVLTPPWKPLSFAADLVQADPETARLLRDHLEAEESKDEVDDAIYNKRLSPKVLNALRPMVARLDARCLLGEIENTESDK